MRLGGNAGTVLCILQGNVHHVNDIFKTQVAEQLQAPVKSYALVGFPDLRCFIADLIQRKNGITVIPCVEVSVYQVGIGFVNPPGIGVQFNKTVKT